MNTPLRDNPYRWVECPKCHGSQSIETNRPGDYLRSDYCPMCSGVGSVLKDELNPFAELIDKINDSFYQAYVSALESAHSFSQLLRNPSTKDFKSETNYSLSSQRGHNS